MSAPRRENDDKRKVTFNTTDAGGHVTKTDYEPVDVRGSEGGRDLRDRHWEGRTLKNPYKSPLPVKMAAAATAAVAAKKPPVKIDSRIK